MGQLVQSVKIREHDLNSSIRYQPEVRYTWLEYLLLCWNLLSGHQFKTSCTFAVHVYKYVIFKGKGLGDRCTTRTWGWVHVAHVERLHTWMCSFRLLVALGLFIFACLRKVCNCMTFFLIFPLTSHTLIMFVGKTQHQFEVFYLFPLPGCTFGTAHWEAPPRTTYLLRAFFPPCTCIAKRNASDIKLGVQA